jgi:hypothetical protein
MDRTHREPEKHRHKLPTSFLHRQNTWGATGTQAQTSYKLLSWSEHMGSQRGTQTSYTALNIKLHNFYNYKINIFASNINETKYMIRSGYEKLQRSHATAKYNK